MNRHIEAQPNPVQQNFVEPRMKPFLRNGMKKLAIAETLDSLEAKWRVGFANVQSSAETTEDIITQQGVKYLDGHKGCSGFKTLQTLQSGYAIRRELDEAYGKKMYRKYKIGKDEPKTDRERMEKTLSGVFYLKNTRQGS